MQTCPALQTRGDACSAGKGAWEREDPKGPKQAEGPLPLANTRDVFPNF